MSVARDERLAVPVPDPEGLTEQQVRGRACVWCAVALNNATAIDLGTREQQAHGTLTHWFPRTCRPCAVLHAYRAQLDHMQSCMQCADEPARCDEGSALRLALRLVRR